MGDQSTSPVQPIFDGIHQSTDVKRQADDTWACSSLGGKRKTRCLYRSPPNILHRAGKEKTEMSNSYNKFHQGQRSRKLKSRQFPRFWKCRFRTLDFFSLEKGCEQIPNPHTHSIFDGVDNGRYCWSSNFELARKNFLPVISGPIGATIAGVFLM